MSRPRGDASCPSRPLGGASATCPWGRGRRAAVVEQVEGEHDNEARQAREGPHPRRLAEEALRRVHPADRAPRARLPRPGRPGRQSRGEQNESYGRPRPRLALGRPTSPGLRHRHAQLPEFRLGNPRANRVKSWTPTSSPLACTQAKRQPERRKFCVGFHALSRRKPARHGSKATSGGSKTNP
jgi:hypothetical protein